MPTIPQRKKFDVKQAAGCLIVKMFDDEPHVLLVHAAGNWKNKLFGIPKGTVDPRESLKQCAIRETEEETGIMPKVIIYLGSSLYKTSKKQVHCFLAKYQSGKIDDKKRAANLQKKEVDVAKFYPLDKAEEMVYNSHRVFIRKAKDYIEAHNGRIFK